MDAFKPIVNSVESCETVSIHVLREFQGELKALSKENYNKLKKQILAHGITSPIHVWEDKHILHILDGHQRIRTLSAMELEGYSVPGVPIVKIRAPDRRKAKQIVLSLASQYGEVVSDGLFEFLSTAELNWDEAKDLLHFPEIDLDKFEDEHFKDHTDKEGLTDDDAIPESNVPKRAALGDIFILGDHRLMCGDSTDLVTVEKLMNDEKADMVFTSPPYNIAKNGFETKGKYERDKDDKVNFASFLDQFMDAWRPHSLFQFVNLQFVSNNKLDIITWLNNQKAHLVDLITCPKDSTLPAMEKNILNADYEMVFVLGESSRTRHIKLGKEFRGSVSNVIPMKRNRSKVDASHRAGFDVSFPMSFLHEFAGPKCVVADPFGGTGTTMIACEKTNRKCFMMELDPHYCDVIIKRWEDFTGLKAMKEEKPILRKKNVKTHSKN